MKTIIDIFTDTARQYPSQVAVADCEGSLSYRELDELSNAVAHRVNSSCVLVILPRRNSFFVSALAAMKAGACYVGCNTNYPADRISYIAEDSGAGTVITDNETWNRLKDKLSPLFPSEQQVILFDDLTTDDITPVNRATWEQEAFMLYTSGTTGKPKGVIHTIGSITRIMQAFAKWDEGRQTPIREGVFGDLCFAASLTDLYTPLFTGGSVHIIDETTRMDMTLLADFINSQHIDRIFLGSSLGVAMMSQFKLNLSQLILAGEKLTGVTPEMAESIDVVNEYGMSEGFPLGMYHVTGREDIIPVGTQSDGDIIYILDPDRHPIPKGQMGEIYFSSDRIAKGYKNLPELSAERFLDDPWRPGYKMLRTSDLGYINEDGNLVHCGRADNMFKINGQRVEPGEVENVAQLFPAMGDCAAVKKEVSGNDTLCMYFEATKEIDTEALRTFMASKLAHYMVPAIIIQVDHLPRNARGKIDRKAMPDPASQAEVKMVPPATDNELLLFDIVTRQLENDHFGVTDDLTLLGMNSIRAMKTAAEAERRGLHVKATDIIKLRDIRHILQSNMLMAYWWQGYDPQKPVMVFVHGIALTSNMKSKLDLLSERFSVFTIENIEEHYQYLFQDESYKEVVLFYDELLQIYLPDDVQLKALAGVSWGGGLAYSLAALWKQRTGQQPTVVMGDTLVVNDAEWNMAFIEGRVDDFCAEHKIPRQAFNESFVKRATIVAKVESRGKVMPTYDGPVILMNALRTPPYRKASDNVDAWRQLASRLTVVDYDLSHDVLCVDPTYTPMFCKHLFDVLE